MSVGEVIHKEVRALTQPPHSPHLCTHPPTAFALLITLSLEVNGPAMKSGLTRDQLATQRKASHQRHGYRRPFSTSVDPPPCPVVLQCNCPPALYLFP